MEQLLFVLGNVFALAVGAAAAHLTMAGREPWRRVLAALGGSGVAILLVLLVLGNTGALRADVAVVVFAVLAGLGAAVCRGRRGATVCAPAPTAPPVPPVHAAAADPAEKLLCAIAVALLAGFGGVLAAKSCFLGTGFLPDDLSFHAAAPAQWLVDGRFSLVPLNWHAYHPYNVEVFTCWFLLPFRGDAYASLTGLYWAALAVVAVIGLGVVRGHAVSSVLLAAALFIASPVIVKQTQNFCAIDLAGIALVLAAFALALPSPSSPPAGRRVDAAYSGLLAGFAAGVKVSFAPAAVILLVWWLLSRHAAPAARGRAWCAAVFVFCVLLTGSYWYVRCFLLTGNPLFPAAVAFFSGPMTKEVADHTRLLQRVLAEPADLAMWSFLGLRHLDWPIGLGVIALAGYGAGLGSALRHAPGPHQAASRLLLAAGLTFCLLYPVMPFSAAGFVRSDPIRIALRYVIPAFALGMVLFPGLCECGARGRTCWWAFAIVAAATAWPGPGGLSPLAAALSAATALAILCSVRLERALRRLVAPLPLALAGIAFFAVLAAWEPYKQRATDRNLASYRVDDRPVGRGWSELERLPAGVRVAAFGSARAGQQEGALYLYYPLFGRNLQLTPVATRADGSRAVALHDDWAAEPRSLWEIDEEPSVERLIANLDELAVDYVLVARFGSDAWPAHRRILAESARARLLFDDGTSALYALAGR